MNYERLIRELCECLPEYMGQRGTPVRGKRNIRCINPAHDDREPSMSFFRGRDGKPALHCFGCKENYDLFDVIGMDYPDCDSYYKRVRKACELFGKEFPSDFGREQVTYTVDQRTQPATEPQSGEVPAPIDYTGLMERSLKECGAGGAYFKGRGLSAAICERYGLFEKEGRAWLPVYTGGRCACYCARAVREGMKPRYKNSPGPMGVFGADYLSGAGKGGVLFITEAIFDALSAEECGFQAVALCGVGNVRKFLALCAGNPAAANSYTMVAAGDADESGRRMNSELTKGLGELGLSCGTVHLPEGVKDLNELLLRGREELKSCLSAAADADALSYAGTSAAGALDALLDFSARRGARQAVSTGFAGMDKVLDGGFYTGLYVIGAVSSLGKTSFLLQIADYIAGQGRDVLYFSMEMDKLELMAKSISRVSWELDGSAGRSDALTARQVLCGGLEVPSPRQTLLDSAIARYKKCAARLFLREGIAEVGTREIRDAVREHIRLRGAAPVVMVDYLQILRPDDPRATDKQNTDRAVVELKRISRDFDLPVVAISSFNRENYRSAVSMEAFKESGAVEYSSDVLFGLQLTGAGEKGFDLNAAKNKTPRDVELIMLKNRSGVPYARLRFAYRAKYGHFTER